MSATDAEAVTRTLERVAWQLNAVTLKLRRAVELARKNNADLALLVEDLEQHLGITDARPCLSPVSDDA